MSRTLIGALILSFMLAHLCGAELVREISWTELAQSGRLESGAVADSTEGAIWRVSREPGEPATLSIFSLNNPGVTRLTWAIVGEIRYEGVTGRGYLEMWNIFEKGEYYSRGLAADGPLGVIRGDSDWRPFVLPFYGNKETGPPLRLEFKIFLPPGSVELRQVRLMEYEPGEPIFDTAAAYALGGWLGAILGGLLGLTGALVGVLAGLGRARKLALACLWGMVTMGVVCLILTLISWLQGYPWPVIYPLALVGLLGTVLGFAFLPMVRRRYAQLELRRMESMDALR